MSNKMSNKKGKGFKQPKELSHQDLISKYPIISSTSKMGDIPTINLPRLVTCRCNAPCARSCYVVHSMMNYNTTKVAYIRNLEVYNSNPVMFFEKIWFFLSRTTTPYFRWHSCGDIPDEQYLAFMCKTARKFKNIKFLCFTKKYELCDLYFMSHKKPKNLNIVYSAWYDLIPENIHNFPMVYLYDKKCHRELNDIFKGNEYSQKQIHHCKYNANNGGCPACINNEKTHCFNMKNEHCCIMNKH